MDASSVTAHPAATLPQDGPQPTPAAAAGMLTAAALHSSMVGISARRSAPHKSLARTGVSPAVPALVLHTPLLCEHNVS